MRTGFLLIVDSDFRNDNMCKTCKERIGNEEFAIEFELQPDPGIKGYEHLRCKEIAEREFLQKKKKEGRA